MASATGLPNDELLINDFKDDSPPAPLEPVTYHFTAATDLRQRGVPWPAVRLVLDAPGGCGIPAASEAADWPLMQIEDESVFCHMYLAA